MACWALARPRGAPLCPQMCLPVPRRRATARWLRFVFLVARDSKTVSNLTSLGGEVEPDVVLEQTQIPGPAPGRPPREGNWYDFRP